MSDRRTPIEIVRDLVGVMRPEEIAEAIEECPQFKPSILKSGKRRFILTVDPQRVRAMKAAQARARQRRRKPAPPGEWFR